MKSNDVKTIVTVALSTATLTVVTFWCGPLEAGGEANVLPAQIAKPKLVSHGLEITLAAAEGQTLKGGDEPVFELTAVNPTGESASAAICVEMTASSPVDMLSRVPRRPAALWQQYLTLPLKPHETKVVTLPARTKLPVNSMIAVSLRESEAPPAAASVAAIGDRGPKLPLRESEPPSAVAAGSLPTVRSALPGAKAPQPGIAALNFSTAPLAPAKAVAL